MTGLVGLRSLRSMSPLSSPSAKEESPAGAGRWDEATVCRKLAPVLRVYALRRLRGDEAVRDFVQDSLVILVQALREGVLSEPAQLAPYALGICRNLLRDGRRATARRQQLLEEHGIPFDSVVEPSPYVSPQGRARLEDCVSKLQRRAREVVQRAFFDELSNKEIADELGLAEGNVRIIRHRTLAALKTCLDRPLSWSAL